MATYKFIKEIVEMAGGSEIQYYTEKDGRFVIGSVSLDFEKAEQFYRKLKNGLVQSIKTTISEFETDENNLS
jgi:hypothetical protein